MATTTKNKPYDSRIYLVGILGWLIPGAGHWLLGLHQRAAVIFIALFTTFLLGVILGSVEMIDPHQAKAWFCAQVLCGLPAIVVTLLQDPNLTVTQFYGRGVDIGQVYTGVAGLLNLLCILDALLRSQSPAPSEKMQLN